MGNYKTRSACIDLRWGGALTEVRAVSEYAGTIAYPDENISAVFVQVIACPVFLVLISTRTEYQRWERTVLPVYHPL